MRTGAALVMAAVAVSAATLTVHGAREAETRPRPELLPSELIWAIYSSCIYTGVPSPIFDAGIAMSVENHRMRVEVMDSAASPEEIASFEAAADDCLARYPVEDERLTRSGNSLGSDAERLLSYDVAQRWLLPCLEGHGILPDRVPTLRDYFTDRAVPWYGYYQDFGVGIDALIEARLACGPGYQPYDS